MNHPALQQSIDLAQQELTRGRAQEAGRHLLDAVGSALEISRGYPSGGPRERWLQGADELLGILEGLVAPASTFLVRERPSTRLSDIAGMDDVKNALRDRVILPLQRPEVARAYGLRAGGGILLYGPPGTGKTAVARAVAGELDADFFTATGADVRSKWHGESEQNLQRLIREARSSKSAVLFLDDVDGLLPSRDGETGADRRLVTQFLQEIGGFTDDGTENLFLLLGATNNPWDLDPAVLRTCRFDQKIYVGLPDQAAREFLIRRQVGEAPVGLDVEIGALATSLNGYTGSDLVAIVDDAKRRAAARLVAGGDGKVRLVDFEAARRGVPPSANRQLLARYEEYTRSSQET